MISDWGFTDKVSVISGREFEILVPIVAHRSARNLLDWLRPACMRHTASVRHTAVSAAVWHKRDVLCCADCRDCHRRRDRHDVGAVAHPVQAQSVGTRREPRVGAAGVSVAPATWRRMGRPHLRCRIRLRGKAAASAMAPASVSPALTRLRAAGSASGGRTVGRRGRAGAW